MMGSVDDDLPDCIDSQIGRQVFRWAIARGALESQPADMGLAQHLEHCARCRAYLPEWRTKSAASVLQREIDRTLSGHLEPDESLASRTLSGGRLLFKYRITDPMNGLLVYVGPHGSILEARARAHRNDFESFGTSEGGDRR